MFTGIIEGISSYQVDRKARKWKAAGWDENDS